MESRPLSHSSRLPKSLDNVVCLHSTMVFPLGLASSNSIKCAQFGPTSSIHSSPLLFFSLIFCAFHSLTLSLRSPLHSLYLYPSFTITHTLLFITYCLSTMLDDITTLPDGTKKDKLEWLNKQLKPHVARVVLQQHPEIKHVPCAIENHHRSDIKFNYGIGYNTDGTHLGNPYQTVSSYSPCVTYPQLTRSSATYLESAILFRRALITIWPIPPRVKSWTKIRNCVSYSSTETYFFETKHLRAQ